MDGIPNYISEDKIAPGSKIYYEQVQDQLICQICSCLLNNPVMCEGCEIPFCSICINGWLDKKKECPNRCNSQKYGIKEINKSLARTLDGLKLTCKYGCEVPLLSYNTHCYQCELSHKEVVCFNCKKNSMYSDLKYKSEEDIYMLKKVIVELEKRELEYEKKLESVLEENQNLEKIIKELDKRQNSGSSNINQLISMRKLDSVIISGEDHQILLGWIPKNDPKLSLIYRASRDGHSCKDFHDYCDNKGSTIVICKTNYGKIIGGFTPCKWISPIGAGQFFRDETGLSFLFSLTLKEMYPLRNEKALAICCNSNYGPIFGNYDLLLVNFSNKNNIGNFDIGTSYMYPGDVNEFYGRTPFKVDDFEVFEIS